MRRTCIIHSFVGVLLLILPACHTANKAAHQNLPALISRYQICMQRLEAGDISRTQAIETLETIRKEAEVLPQTESLMLQAHILLQGDEASAAAEILERCTPDTPDMVQNRNLLIEELTLRRQDIPDLDVWLSSQTTLSPQSAQFALAWLEHPLPFKQKSSLVDLLGNPVLASGFSPVHQEYLKNLKPRLLLAQGKLPEASDLKRLTPALAEALPTFWQQEGVLPALDWISAPPAPRIRPRVLLFLHPREPELPAHLPKDPHLWILTRKLPPPNEVQNLGDRLPAQIPFARVRRGVLMDRWGIEHTPTWIRMDDEGRVLALWQGTLAQADLNLWLASPPPARPTQNTPKETNHG